ncbi:2-succinyl-5-enolpyruvyl-6-hydroxy-3-cyclohexene-1-carboxylic-acid synthase [Actinotalea sp. K2]|uniref:2-succinyl-5-enolpyruvyl-6-hydroxy-3- cyclohexene-1-carboxylic-acid synthase n=1 Tax=Actinotalea sp. K2 TaxID=2939438 RepID=UPI002017E518|nr:2-succinyl-5-enolpyruvyl-6-hydroxy-3-cyclohexene-1-carboxylic-acid synthase [Actinotalea sp. K2]MCL3863044.1 2-succinyl-5-enolpyruvyl-6-hydroxy-3-cyclohexene-1-carboxylic-acid synthase [Actinotalea sp. K2]
MTERDSTVPGAPGNPSTRAARVLVQALADLGVRHVVLAPGSRSAPLAHAVAECARPDADRDPAAPALDLHVRIDERSAGFLALGLAQAARARGALRPVAVVTTSGTAVANLHPAVLEAYHAGLPLLLLTADRPHELRGTGANQTTEQVGLLEPVRLTLDVPAPTGRPGEDRDLRHLAARAVAAATGARTGDPGPVHLDLSFRDPLVPGEEPWPDRVDPGLTAVVPRGGAGTGVQAGDAPAGAEPLRTVVVAGDGAGPAARDLAEAHGWPLLAEPTSGAWGGACTIPAYRLLLAEPHLGGRVQRVVVLGRPTLSRPVQELLGREDVDTVVVAPWGAAWPDATRSARLVVTDLRDLPVRPVGTSGHGGPDGVAWLARWQEAGRRASSAVGEVLARSPRPTGPQVAAAVVAATAPDGVLVVGSSNPVRDLDLVGGWRGSPLVLANRGLAGIDGVLSTASGVALALAGPVRAYVGDLTFLHDVGGLLVGPLERRPDLQVVVANDDGGSIFATLEHGEPQHTSAFERVFGTPHGADIGALCAGYGVAHVRVDELDGLRAVLARPVTGTSVVEVGVDRSGRRDLHAALARAVRDAVHGG